MLSRERLGLLVGPLVAAGRAARAAAGGVDRAGQTRRRDHAADGGVVDHGGDPDRGNRAAAGLSVSAARRPPDAPGVRTLCRRDELLLSRRPHHRRRRRALGAASPTRAARDGAGRQLAARPRARLHGRDGVHLDVDLERRDHHDDAADRARGARAFRIARRRHQSRVRSGADADGRVRLLDRRRRHAGRYAAQRDLRRSVHEAVSRTRHRSASAPGC